jgi:hypothetical protein
MSDVRHNEFSGWKARLEQTDLVPEYDVADKDATWDKLYDRLHRVPRRRVFHLRRRRSLYWIAAAFVLLVLTMNHSRGRKEFRERKENAALAPLPPYFSPARPGVVAGQEAGLKKITNFQALPLHSSVPAKTALFRQENHSAGLKPDMRTKQAVVLTADSSVLFQGDHFRLNQETSPPAYAMIVQRDKPGKETATIPSTLNTGKKEWRIVHINELGNPAAEGQSMTSNRDYRTFRIHFGSPENLSAPSPATFSSDITILKIRLSPTNH